MTEPELLPTDSDVSATLSLGKRRRPVIGTREAHSSETHRRILVNDLGRRA